MKRLLVGATTISVLALTASAAQASTTVGSTAPSSFSSTTSAPTSYIQRAGSGYAVPAGHWVLLSASARLASGSATPAASAVVARPTGTTGEFLIVRSLPFDVEAFQPSTVEQSVPASGVKVQGGDLLGLALGADMTAYFDSSAGGVVASTFGFVAAGSTYTFTDDPEHFVMSVSAVLEPDADQDGSGDETQDACPANPAERVAPCAPLVTPPTCELPKKARKALVGKTLAQAKKKIKRADCQVGKVKKPKNVPEGKVLRVAKVTLKGDTAGIRLKAVPKPR